MQDHQSVDRNRRRRGATMVEGVLVLFAFLVMLIGVLDFGQFLFMHQSLAERVRWAARSSAVKDLTTTAVQNLVVYGTASPTDGQRESPGLLGLTPSNVTVSYESPDTNATRLAVSVRNLSYSVFSPLMAGTYRNLPIRISVPLETP